LSQNLNIINYRVRSFTLDSNELYWEIENTTLDPLDFYFYVLRSESPDGPWDVIAGPFEDKYSYVDLRVNPIHLQRQIHYRIRSAEKKDPENVVETESFMHYPDPDLIASEIQRAERIVWNEFAGRACLLLPVRTFGQRCRLCYDGPEKGKGFTSQKRRAGCVSCYDTSFVRGYFDPIKIYVQIDPSTDSVQNHPIIQRMQNDTRARLPNHPLLKPKDLLIEAENKRWHVVTVTPTERLRSVVHQELTLHEIDRSEVEYQVPVRIEDLRELQASPMRNFVNAQDIDTTTNPAVADVFDIYRRQW